LHAGRVELRDEVRIRLGDRRHEVPARAEHVERALDGVAAEFLDELPLAPAGGRDHVRAELFRDLGRDMADPATTP
jgi:hypothetical protein